MRALLIFFLSSSSQAAMIAWQQAGGFFDSITLQLGIFGLFFYLGAKIHRAWMLSLFSLVLIGYGLHSVQAESHYFVVEISTANGDLNLC